LEVVVPRVTPNGPPGTVWIGGHPDEVHLSLWVQGDALDPDAVSQVLGCAPTRSKRKGEPILSDSGEVRRIARMGSWQFSYQPDPDATIAEAIQVLFAGLPGDRGVWEALTSRFSAELVCELTLRCFNRGFALPPELLDLLAARRVTLSFDVSYLGDLQERDALLDRIGAAEPGGAPDTGRDS
jgi:hypothetical protein